MRGSPGIREGNSLGRGEGRGTGGDGHGNGMAVDVAMRSVER